MVRKRALSEEQAQALIEDYREWDNHDPNDQRTMQWFADKYGVSVATVNRELRDRGEPLKPHRRPLARPATASPVEVNVPSKVFDAFLEANARIRYLEGLLRAKGIDFD